jgi:hypothetical protein
VLHTHPARKPEEEEKLADERDILSRPSEKQKKIVTNQNAREMEKTNEKKSELLFTPSFFLFFFLSRSNQV